MRSQLEEVEHAHDALEEMMNKLAGVDSMRFAVLSARVRLHSGEHGIYDVQVTRTGELTVQPQRHEK